MERVTDAGEGQGDLRSRTFARFTEMGDEFLRRVDNLQQFLEELV